MVSQQVSLRFVTLSATMWNPKYFHQLPLRFLGVVTVCSEWLCSLLSSIFVAKQHNINLSLVYWSLRFRSHSAGSQGKLQQTASCAYKLNLLCFSDAMLWCVLDILLISFLRLCQAPLEHVQLVLSLKERMKLKNIIWFNSIILYNIVSF